MKTTSKRRVACEFCARKFGDEASRDRHSRQLHRKAFGLVRELRRELELLKQQWNRAHGG